MTEDEAKTKWCPFVRHANGSNGAGVNRINWDRTYDYANCIGSACMAWRWDSIKPLQPSRDGHCGLAGDP